jgi:predicted DNA-binding transcriptional regulator AlpA
MLTEQMDTMAPSDQSLIAASEFARILDVSARTLWRLNSAQRIPAPVRLGGIVRWRLEEIKNWIAEGCPLPQARENRPRRK